MLITCIFHVFFVSLQSGIGWKSRAIRKGMPKALPALQFFGLLNFGKIMENKKEAHRDDCNNVRTLYGTFYVDVKNYASRGTIINTAYRTWVRMVNRCNDEEYLKINPTYNECSICDEWHYFSNFLRWFKKNHIVGYELDKDILGCNAGKVYSPETCCFVPQEINKLLLKRTKKRGKYPIGVYSPKKGVYLAQMSINHKIKTIGSFKNELDAFMAYKKAKEKYIKEKALDYYNKGKISKKVFDVLYSHEINYND